MSNGNSTGSGGMAKVFFQSATTPLLFDFWEPRNAGEYVGTCIFLAVFAAATRILFAIKSPAAYMGSGRRRRRHHGHHRYQPQPRQEPGQVQEEDGDETASAMKEDGWDWKNDSQGKSPSLLSRLGRATSETVLAGLGYLLMLAVMTMNVGYFLSVLAGTFLGTLLTGAAGSSTQRDHC
ncbi:Ctr copper transporter [Parachaetomium inaequale]|uniref:Copper transport protein n=1 Tax=Parachaetomium inaequale TaxID=2588326 RepID=A0AAN6PE45_9PEZI|nr:Ctr copper transporter [Parachaetomium inaequale]